MNVYQFLAISIALTGSIFLTGMWLSLISKQLQKIIQFLEKQ